jgi:arylsulfatase A-like enzyme
MTRSFPWYGLVVVGCFAALGSARAADVARPNVVILIVDDQGYGDLGCHGNPVVKTPQLDRLHAESVRLTDFHVAPMCTPTRGQLLSGRDALANGAMNVSSGRSMLRRGIPTMANFFAEAGYRCGQFGKWHLGENHPYRPHERGFDEAVYFTSSHIGSASDPWNNDYFDDVYLHNGVREQYRGYCTDVFFNEAMRYAEASHDAGKPFFVYLALNAAHGPLFVPKKYREPYADQDERVARYYGMVANIDENVGRFQELLRARKLIDDTIFIYLTDNGATFGAPIFNAGMRGKKIDLTDGGHRVPCFLRWPNGNLGVPRDIPDLTICQDLLPTLIDLCQLPAKQHEVKFDGLSLAGLLRGARTQPTDRMAVVQFSRIGNPHPQKGDAALLWNRLRLVNDRELYDVASDPAQQRNLFADRPDDVARMRKHYDAWWSRVEPTLDEHEFIIVGSDAENPLRLAPTDWSDVFLDQQLQIRAAAKAHGFWNIEVDRDGEYELTVSRWPLEADLPITAAAPAFVEAESHYPAGGAVAATSVRLQVGDFEASRPIDPDDRAVRFVTSLKAGRTQLQAQLYNRDDKPMPGAYYVEVRRR